MLYDSMALYHQQNSMRNNTIKQALGEVLTMKRLVLLFLLFLFVIRIPVLTIAEDSNPDDASLQNCVTVYTSQKEREIYVKKESERIIRKLESATEKGPKYRYKIEYLSKQYKTLGGDAGNQASGGYQFPTGGGFWFTDSGGPSVSGSIYLSLPSPYNCLSFSINLGQKGVSGLYVNAPDTIHYFKLYVSKKLELTPYIMYRKLVGAQHDSDPWEFDYAGLLQSVYSVSAYARRIN